jgi:homoserine O-succinyltransferase
VKKSRSELTRGFDEEFYVPHSRNTQILKEDVSKIPTLDILAASEEAGPHILATRDNRLVFVQGHNEYDRDTLRREYERDVAKGLRTAIPANYFENDDPAGRVIVNWSCHGNLFFANWLNFVYQETPYELADLDKMYTEYARA